MKNYSSYTLYSIQYILSFEFFLVLEMRSLTTTVPLGLTVGLATLFISQSIACCILDSPMRGSVIQKGFYLTIHSKSFLDSFEHINIRTHTVLLNSSKIRTAKLDIYRRHWRHEEGLKHDRSTASFISSLSHWQQ